ncbi:excalibur calcium-binding domain-containing protein [Deinococcus sp.]|uniref:excalibur calcium-binding domain-containing protein n=1 Tax=Deinococcus sp. TaxID=47478 RepID=UPI00344BE62B
MYRTDQDGTVTVRVRPGGQYAVSTDREAAPQRPVAPAPKPTIPVPSPAAQYNISYRNCAAVRAAGQAPLRLGPPGYSRKLDRDGDGVACE